MLRSGAVAAVAGTGVVGATTPVSATGTQPGEMQWAYDDISCAQVDSFHAPPTVVDGRVYAGTTCQHLQVVDAAGGTEVDTLYARASTGRPPAVVNDIAVVMPNNEALQTFDQNPGAAGEVDWEADVGGSVTTVPSSPTVHDGTVYVSNHDGPAYAHALDLWTGEERWSYDGEELGSSPVVVDGMVYIAGEGGVLVALDAETGAAEWSLTTGPTRETAPTVADGVVYLGTDDGAVYAVEASTGDVSWELTLGETVPTTPTVADGTLYVANSDGSFFALDAATGDEEWQFDTGGWPASATVVDDTVFVGGQALIAIDDGDGSERWRFDEGVEEHVLAPVVVDGTVFVAVDNAPQDGILYAIDAGVDGSSEDSRVMLGTSGHHDGWATAAAATRPSTFEGSGDEDGDGDGSDDSESGETDGDDGTGTGDDGGSSGDDGLPAPGLVGTLASLGGATYLFSRWGQEREDE